MTQCTINMINRTRHGVLYLTAPHTPAKRISPNADTNSGNLGELLPINWASIPIYKDDRKAPKFIIAIKMPEAMAKPAVILVKTIMTAGKFKLNAVPTIMIPIHQLFGLYLKRWDR